MKNILKSLWIILIFSSSFSVAQLKTKYPNVGEKLDDHTFTDLANYPNKTVSLSELRGRWVLLDVWGYSCSGCIATFPKMDEIQAAFRDKLQIIMVGATKGQTGNVKKAEAITKQIYERQQKEHNLKMTFAFDSLFYWNNDIGSVPHIMILNPEGILVTKAKTVSKDQIEALINGGKPYFMKAYSRSEPRDNDDYNKDIPFLTRGTDANGGSDTSFMFRSVLAKSTSRSPKGSIFLNRPKSDFFAKDRKELKSGKLEIFRKTLKSLYFVAYFGQDKLYDDRDTNYVGKVSDDINFSQQDSAQLLYKTRFDYSLIVPKERASKELFQKIMQDDLENYFGYKAKKEMKSITAYYLDVIDPEKFSAHRTKGSASATSPIKKSSDEGVVFVNQPTSFISKYIGSKLSTKPNFFDRTNSAYNIDLELNTYMRDLKRINEQLVKAGLKIVEGTKAIEQLVLSK